MSDDRRYDQGTYGPVQQSTPHKHGEPPYGSAADHSWTLQQLHQITKDVSEVRSDVRHLGEKIDALASRMDDHIDSTCSRLEAVERRISNAITAFITTATIFTGIIGVGLYLTDKWWDYTMSKQQQPTVSHAEQAEMPAQRGTINPQ